MILCDYKGQSGKSTHEIFLVFGTKFYARMNILFLSKVVQDKVVHFLMHFKYDYFKLLGIAVSSYKYIHVYMHIHTCIYIYM